MKDSAFLPKNYGLFILFLFISPSFVHAQVTSYYFYVQFTDKNNTPYAFPGLLNFYRTGLLQGVHLLG